MLRSLVGSEMCIRDRLDKVPNISLNGHHSWNTKESDWWRDALKKETRCQSQNQTCLRMMATESKKMYPADKEPRTVLNTSIPVMTEGTLRRISLGNGLTRQPNRVEPQPRPASVTDGQQWEGRLLARHGLEFADEMSSVIRLAGRNRRMPRVEEIEALHMTTLMHGPHSARVRNAIKGSATPC
eukprot:TRINITY_DN37814_c0_g1_i1.p1 TRINITY_DN37814_c0_g1~~TRINITY_DN37814_c0_g1_i1.p1  ORF type:complete len:184 (+),score=33.66 TRINITY_DN37814_c0_g1_i1:137-688(+)